MNPLANIYIYIYKTHKI